jgi:hypothetical protein
VAPPFTAWGWPSELEEPATVSSEEFLSRLAQLKELYLSPQTDHTWLPKQRLGYFYDFFPNTRHALLRPLLDVDWREHRAALRGAVERGATIVLTGEDLGLCPDGGLSTYPHRDAHQLEAISAVLENADWQLATWDGDTIVATVGQGTVVLCRESIDAAGHDNPSVVTWQRRWLAELQAGKREPLPIPAPSRERLRQWWIGEASIADQPRTVTWLRGNVREVSLELDEKDVLGKTCEFVLPPHGNVTEATVELQIDRGGPLRVDVGCDGVIDTELQASGTLDWTELLRRYEPRYRDGNGWRIVPVRWQSAQPARVLVRNVRLTVK